MELTKLLNEMETFIRLVNSRRDDIMKMVDELSLEVDSFISQLKVFTATNQCVVPTHILKDFPDVKRRVVVNLVSLINEEIRIIDKKSGVLYDVSKDMRKSHEKILRLMSEINWSELSVFYSACVKIAEWIEACWKSLHFLYVNVSNGIKFFGCDHSHSAMHMKRVCDIKPFDRSVLFAAPDISHLLTMLRHDITTRTQNVGNYS